MSKPKAIEQLKNILLVVLFLSTVLLLYFFWGNDSYREARQTNQQMQEDAIEDHEIVRPEKIIVNFGEENYTVIDSENSWIWNDPDQGILAGMTRFGEAESILAEEITYKQYQDVMNYRSIRAEFSYDIPTDDFCRIFDMDKPQSYDTVKNITIIGFSTYSPERIFIYDGKNLKYYMLMAQDAQTGLDTLITSVEAQGYNPYYPVSIVVGVENSTLIPVSIKSNLRDFPYQQDVYPHQTEKINYLAEKFFGENFDFVRKMKESDGTLIYMYGYGQQVLIANTDGSFEYKEEQTNDSPDQGFYDSLQTAIQFISSHGDWQALDGTPIHPYLKNVIEKPNEKKGYEFILGLETNGRPIYYEKGNPFVIDVANGQVIYFKRNVIDYQQSEAEVDLADASSYQEAFTAVNVIANNYSYIGHILKAQDIVKDTGAANGTGSLEDISAMITDMKTGYVKTNVETGENEVIPVWIVTVNHVVDFYFDLYHAEPKGFSVNGRGR